MIDDDDHDDYNGDDDYNSDDDYNDYDENNDDDDDDDDRNNDDDMHDRWQQILMYSCSSSPFSMVSATRNGSKGLI
jgi:hypothetical protein